MWFLSSVVLFTIVSYGATALQPRADSDILALYPECAVRTSGIVDTKAVDVMLRLNPAKLYPGPPHRRILHAIQ